MSYKQRLELYKKIEDIRGRPLLVYITSLRPNASGQMAPDVIPEIIQQIVNIPESQKEIDLLVVSNGGDPIVAWRIVNLLRERFARYNVVLPYVAYSAATLLALGADQIAMHPFANLGPVDPQITSTRQSEGHGPQVNNFGSEDLRHYLAFVREDVGITDQEQLRHAFELLCKDVGALGIGSAKRSSQLMLSLGEKLLSLHMSDKNEARTIAESLSRSFYHHGYSVGRKEAKNLRLAVEEGIDTQLENLIWDVWQSVSLEMECDSPFDPLEIVSNDQGAANSLNSAYQVCIPANLPPGVQQQAYNNVLQQIRLEPIVPAPFNILFAVVESLSGHSEFTQRGEIRATRLPDMNLNINITSKSQKWTRSKNSTSVIAEN